MDLQKEIKKILKERNLLTVQQYADKHHLTPWYVAKLCRNEKLKAFKVKPGNLWVIESKQK